MKRTLSLLLAALMLVLCLPMAAGAAPSRDPEPNTFTIGSFTGVTPGSDISVPISISGPDYEAHGVRIELFYDPDYLNVTSYTYGPVSTGKPQGSLLMTNITRPGYVSYCIICPNAPFSGTGVMLTLNMHVSEDFDGLTELDLNVPEFYYYPIDGSRLNLPKVVEDGYVTTTVAHAVDFVDWDGTLLKHELVAEGEDATPPANPVRPGHTFTGWDGDYTNVTEDVTITAQYEINYYTVTFIDSLTQEQIDSQSVIYNGSATAPQPPEHKGYDFVGWSRDFSCITSNTVVLALYETTMYTVVFLDWDGTVLSEQQVLPGEPAIAPPDPEREGYIFTGWDSMAFLNVTEDLTIRATYTVIKFKVTFYDWDGKTEISHMNVPYGQAATAPEPPVHVGHIFVGWSEDFSAVYSDLDVIALYDEAIFIVRFVDWDGTLLSEQEVLPHEAAVPPADPERQGYTFIGWDKDFNDIISDLTVTAQYEINKYTVTFVDMDGSTVIDTQTVVYGGAAEAPEAPVHEGFVFTGWDKDFSCVTEDMTVTALYEVQTFTVTFVDMDGTTVIDTQTVVYGGDAEAPEAPEHEGYTFIGWDTDYTNVTSDLTVTAQYELNKYMVTFLDMDGETVIDVLTVNYGEAAEAPEAPVHEGLVFTGWDKDFSCVTEDMIVTAQYEIQTFTVLFVDMDEMTVIDRQIVNYGDDATAPEAPVHEGYAFIGWLGEYTNVTSDRTIVAQYEQTAFTVTFVDMDGTTVIDVQTVNYGEAAEAPEAPVHEGYTFTGWDGDFSCVTEDMTVTAQYEINTYTVTFVDMDGETVIDTQTVTHGEAAEAPEAPEHEGYTFTGWDRDFSCVTEDMTVTAQYEINTYTVTFVDPYGETISVQTVNYGEAAEAPEAPEIPLRIFLRWDADFSCVTEDMTVTAVYALLGDVDFNDKIDTSDALHILRRALGLEEFSDDQTLVGDVDLNGVIDTADALHVLRMALGLE